MEKYISLSESVKIIGRSKSSIKYQYESLPESERMKEGGRLYMTEEGLNILLKHFKTERMNGSNESIPPERTNEKAERKPSRADIIESLKERIKALEIENAVLNERIARNEANERTKNELIESLKNDNLFLKEKMRADTLALHKALPEPRESFWDRLFKRKQIKPEKDE